MKRCLKSMALLLVIMAASSGISVSDAKAADTELFIHKSPDFTLTVPKWIDQKSPDPNFVFNRKAGPDKPTALAISVSDLPADKRISYKDLAPAFKKILELQNGSDVQILHDKEIRLQDGTPAYEIEAKWKLGKWPFRMSLHSYVVVVLKDKKSIWVCISDTMPVEDNLKQYPLSLKFK
ncbi:MAG: hypothetical protein KA113_16300 [Syntrophaceae bacterium]|nr:hypothetical protein [Syntrophaceae bacterium]